jgi:WD40 repeat protein
MTFSNDSSRLALATQDGNIYILDVSASNSTNKESEREVAIHHVFKHRKTVMRSIDNLEKDGDHNDNGAGGNDDFSPSKTELLLESSVKEMAFSFCGQYLAVTSGGRNVYIYEMDRFKLHWSVPRTSSPVTGLAFHPNSPSLFLLLAGQFVKL